MCIQCAQLIHPLSGTINREGLVCYLLGLPKLHLSINTCPLQVLISGGTKHEPPCYHRNRTLPKLASMSLIISMENDSSRYLPTSYPRYHGRIQRLYQTATVSFQCVNAPLRKIDQIVIHTTNCIWKPSTSISVDVLLRRRIKCITVQ